MITYNETIERGFKRHDLGGDSVWFDKHGYEWFITQRTLFKNKKQEIIADWCPEEMAINIQRIDNH